MTEKKKPQIKVEKKIELNASEEAEKLQPASPTPELPSSDERIKELEDRVLRLQAEMENIKKRSEKENLRVRESAGSDVMLSLLTFLDEFSIAMQHAEKSGEKEFKDGMKMVYKKFSNSLQQMGLEEMKCEGEQFDPYKHDAVREEEGKEGKILEVVQKGYYLRGNILRHAKVIVGKKKK